MSHDPQIQEQTQPMEVKKGPGIPPPSPHLKKKAFGGLYHTKKMVPFRPEKKTKMSSLGRGH